MAISSLGGIGLDTSISATANTAASALNQDDFLKIFLTQLNYQDPLKPLDNQQFIAQLAQFTQVEQSHQLNTKLDNLLSIQSITQAVGVLGRTVEVATSTGNVVGTVGTLLFNSG
ncbi:MAG: flagellar hook capping protein, partial [Burkholderiaceae bacterium]|nr:flagellar hook capping protein [Burkholderiaceae bacterium]